MGGGGGEGGSQDNLGGPEKCILHHFDSGLTAKEVYSR